MDESDAAIYRRCHPSVEAGLTQIHCTIKLAEKSSLTYSAQSQVRQMAGWRYSAIHSTSVRTRVVYWPQSTSSLTHLPEPQLSKAFDRCWPEPELRLKGILAHEEVEQRPLRSADELASETLGVVREVAKRLDVVASSFRAPYADSGDFPEYCHPRNAHATT